MTQFSAEFEAQMYTKAVKAYERWCKKNGAVFMYPAEDATRFGRKYIYLYNVNGLLARYNMETKEISV